ncbi:MAG: saccharopine dehydrogenase NADP-binding domain-containing protein [Planctomycetaceae bacterium]|nr:saccharopine dehydrogenase NADP-binding domain-containing protein [Planctomycetaceae bacterium]
MHRILIQLDTDPQPSVFDRVVAVDAGVEQLFSYGGVTPATVTPLVHGAIFTRGPADLKHTAIFVGGSDVPAGEALVKTIRKAFFGPMRVSVMMDSNGCNTTAAAAVRAAAKHIELKDARALVLGGTGPVGQRAALLLAGHGAFVTVGSRSRDKAAAVCEAIQSKLHNAQVEPVSGDDAAAAIADTQVVIAAGATGVQFLSADQWRSSPSLRVAIDLNAVPPAGLEGIDVMAKAAMQGPIACYGAIGVGGAKMKLHKRALQRLFEQNDVVLDTTEIYDLASELR